MTAKVAKNVIEFIHNSRIESVIMEQEEGEQSVTIKIKANGKVFVNKSVDVDAAITLFTKNNFIPVKGTEC